MSSGSVWLDNLLVSGFVCPACTLHGASEETTPGKVLYYMGWLETVSEPSHI